MICRIWRGWTTPQNADAYESVVRAEVIPGIEALRIEGFRHIDLLRRASDLRWLARVTAADAGLRRFIRG